MQIKIKTSKGVYNATDGWTGHIDDIVDELRNFFNSKRLDDIAEIVKDGVLDDLDSERKPDGGSLRPLKPLTIKYKKGKKLNETGRLRSQIDYVRRGDKRVVKVIGDRGEVAGYLQFGTNRMEAFYWFGVSEAVKAKIKKYIETEWGKILRKVG